MSMMLTQSIDFVNAGKIVDGSRHLIIDVASILAGLFRDPVGCKTVILVERDGRRRATHRYCEGIDGCRI